MPKPIPYPVPPERDLRSLYHDQRLTTAQIAERYGVSDGLVLKWMRRREIKLRPAGTGLRSRGVKPPSPDELHQMIHVEHLSYERIAKKYSVDLTAVPYWLDKYGLPRSQTWFDRHSSPDVLAEMHAAYMAGASLKQIGDRHEGVAGSTVSDLFRAHGLPRRKGGWDGGKRFVCDDGHEVRSTYEQRVDNWLYEHGIEHTYEPQLPFSPMHKADFAANGWYIEVWGVNSNPAYKERKQRKIDLYRAHLCPLIEIPYYAFAKSFKGLWFRRLEQCLQPVLPLLLSENPIQ